MNKLSLNLDALRVETFETAAPAGERGTVLGEQASIRGNTCAPSCPYTCGIIPQTNDCRFGRNTHDCPACV